MMNYIKTYESFDSLKLEIEDILRELEDINIRVDVNKWSGGYLEVFLSNISEHKVGNLMAPNTFQYEIIKPNIEHLVSFLNGEGYTLKSIYNIVGLVPKSLDYSELDGKVIGRLELRFFKI